MTPPEMERPPALQPTVATLSTGRHSLEQAENTPAVCVFACGRQACPWVCPGGAA